MSRPATVLLTFPWCVGCVGWLCLDQQAVLALADLAAVLAA